MQVSDLLGLHNNSQQAKYDERNRKRRGELRYAMNNQGVTNSNPTLSQIYCQKVTI